MDAEPQSVTDIEEHQEHQALSPNQEVAVQEAPSNRNCVVRVVKCSIFLVLLIGISIAFGLNRGAIIEALSSVHVDKSNALHGLIFVLVGLGLFVTQVIGLSPWWVFPTAYFFQYHAFIFVLVVCLLGISINFWGGRWIQQCKECHRGSEVGLSHGPASPTSSVLERLKSKFESEPFKFVTLLFFSPLPMGILCTMFGTSTTVPYWIVLTSGTVSMLVQALPIILIGAAAESLVEAFDDPANVISTVLTIVGSLCIIIFIAVYTRRELQKLDQLDLTSADLMEGTCTDLELAEYAPVGIQSPGDVSPKGAADSPLN